MKYNPAVEYIQTLIRPLASRHTRGNYSVQVLPREDLTDDETTKYWRFFNKFPNEFAAAVYRNLPSDVEFVSYEHLRNQLNLIKL